MRSVLLSRSLITALFIVMGNAAPLMAQTAGKDLAAVTAGTYDLDKSHASLLFKISHLGYSMYHGRFDSLDGKLTFDPKAPEKSTVEVTVDTGSIDTNNEKLQGELKGDKFFNTVKFPAATFKSTSVTRSGDSGTLTGDLTMLGVTKPVTLHVTFHGAGIGAFSKKETLGFAANGTIKRSDWGMNALVPMVGDDVQIEIEAEFNKAAAPATATATPPAAGDVKKSRSNV